MSNFFSSVISSSVSYSFSSTSNNGQRSGQAYRHESHSTPEGTSTRTTSQKLGGPMVQETRHYDSNGRELLGSGQPHNRPAIQQQSSGAVVEELDDSEDDPAHRRMIEGGDSKRQSGA